MNRPAYSMLRDDSSAGTLAACGAVLAACLLAASGSVHAASDEAATEQVRARLVASVDAVYPGAEILLGLNQRIIPHWHTYWKNPGDSGLPTTIDWALPPGASAGEILWPVPSRIALGPVTNFAYSNEVTLLTPVKVPADLKAGDRFPVSAKVKWLVCEETCIPQQVELGLTLPVAAGPSDAGQGSPLIETALATLPVASPWPVSFGYGKDAVTLRIETAALRPESIADIQFFPDLWGRIAHGAVQERTFDESGVTLKLLPGESPAAPGDAWSGVLVITEKNGEETVTQGYSVGVQASVSAPVAVPAGRLQTGDAAELTLVPALALAWLGGLILNLMPCVFPVLSLKALHLLKQAEEAPGGARLHGLAYTAGVVLSFGLLAGLLILLKSGGAAIGWGFQFQSPVFVLAVAYLMFTVGLSLSGVVTLGGSVAGVGSSLAARSGYAGSFFTGVLASVVAAPCTAPFMGAAIGFALTQPPELLLAVFFSLGLGLASPYLLLSNWPRLQRILPRPGAWMETLKQGLAFPMYATAAWLVWVLARQGGDEVVAVALAGMIALAFAAWLYDRARRDETPKRQLGTTVAGLFLASALAGGYVGVDRLADSAAPASATAGEGWEPYTPERLQALRARGEPVFLNFTAAWCISCLVNERVALRDPAVGEAFHKAGVTYLKGDWTNRDPRITEKLEEFGRSGVPLYVLYPAGAGAAPVVLPQILTPQIVISAIAPATASVNSNLVFKE